MLRSPARIVSGAGTRSPRGVGKASRPGRTSISRAGERCDGSAVPRSAGSTFLTFTSSRRTKSHARLAASVAEIRYRHLAGRREAAHPRHRQGEARHRAREPRPLRPLQGQGVDGLRQVAQGQAGRQAHPGDGDLADACGRRQDHHHGRPHRRAQPHRQEGDAVPARAVARAVVRHEGRRGGRRLCPGDPDGGYQPPLHRRLPRHHLGAQPAVGADRQPHLLGQCARHRLAPRRVAPRHGHERPRAARDRVLARRRRQRLSARRPASTSRSPPR